MIYYYFGSKEGLYVTVLEEAYRRIRRIEGELHLEDLAPEEALRKLVGFTVDYQLANPDFIRLVMNENIHHGEFLAQSKTIQELNVPAIDAVRAVYERGVAAGVFRGDLDPVDLHMSISALCFFNVVQPTHLLADLQARHRLAEAHRVHAATASSTWLVRYVRK